MQSLRLLLMAGLALFAVYAVPTAWALHIGGQFTRLRPGSETDFALACRSFVAGS